jgi:hypothetical protein
MLLRDYALYLTGLSYSAHDQLVYRWQARLSGRGDIESCEVEPSEEEAPSIENVLEQRSGKAVDASGAVLLRFRFPTDTEEELGLGPEEGVKQLPRP